MPEPATPATPATPADRLLTARSALQGVMAHYGDALPPEKAADISVTYADALLRRLGRGAAAKGGSCEWCGAAGGGCSVCNSEGR